MIIAIMHNDLNDIVHYLLNYKKRYPKIACLNNERLNNERLNNERLNNERLNNERLNNERLNN